MRDCGDGHAGAALVDARQDIPEADLLSCGEACGQLQDGRAYTEPPCDVTGLRVAWSGAFEEATGSGASRPPVQRTEMFLR
jgi:hypothetical protein